MYYFLLVLSTVSGTVKSLVLKKLGKDFSGSKDIYLLNSLMLLVASTAIGAYVLFIEKSFGVSSFSLVVAILFGLSIVLSQLLEAHAMKHGPVSMTAFIYSLGLIFPIIYGSLFLSEEISVMQLLGMALAFLAVYFIVNPEKNAKINLLWLVLAVLASCFAGSNGVIQKAHQSSPYKSELYSFIFLSLLFASVFSLACAAFVKYKSGKSSAEKPKFDFKFISIGGIAIGLVNILNLVLAGKIEAVIQFPVYNIGGMILTILGGRLIFGEKMSKNQIIGLGFGCISILIIGLL
jgi:drug/metabolite transporter (DMT)-like permease